MSALRDEIRAILREEIAALHNEATVINETVQVRSSADLNRFAQELLKRAEDPTFVSQVTSGRITFALAETSVAGLSPTGKAIVTSPPTSSGVMINKSLVTERDITELGAKTKLLRLPNKSRLTPLAKDEARRIGIRIERVET